MYVYVGPNATACMWESWESENNFEELFFLSHPYMGSGMDGTQVSWLCSKHLYPVSPFNIPEMETMTLWGQFPFKQPHRDWCSTCCLQTCYVVEDDFELVTCLPMPSKCWVAELHHHALFVNFICWSRISIKLTLFIFCFAFVCGTVWGSHCGPCMASPGSCILNPVFSLFFPSVFPRAVQLYEAIHIILKPSSPSPSSGSGDLSIWQNCSSMPILKVSRSSLVQSRQQPFCFQFLQT